MNYQTLANKEILTKTEQALNSKGYKVYTSATKSDALKQLISIIPAGVTLMNGASVSLDQIGFTEYLKSGKHNWKNMHEEIFKDSDQAKQQLARKQATLSEYYVGSVHALTQEGDFIIASNTGSQLPNIVFSSPNLIFVVSTKKIVPDLNDAMLRLENSVIPLENERVKKAYGVPTTSLNKILLFKSENKMMGRTVSFILVTEDLGF